MYRCLTGIARSLPTALLRIDVAKSRPALGRRSATNFWHAFALFAECGGSMSRPRPNSRSSKPRFDTSASGFGLGVRFETQVNTVFARLVDNPFQFPVIEEGVRRAIVRVFPYAVYFTLEVDLITVLAVLHMHRHPDTWKPRRRDTE